MAFGNGPKIVTSGLILSLDAADRNSYSGTGTVWNDLSGNGNTGTLTNGPTYSSTNGGSIVFDGSNDYVNLGSTNYVSRTAPFTICQWLKLNPRTINGTQSDFHRFFTLKSEGASTFGVALVTQTQFDYQGLYITNNNGWIRRNMSPIFYPSYNTWNFLTLTYNGSGSTDVTNFKIYWNAVQLEFSETDGFVPGLTDDGNFLGARIPGDIQIYKGEMASFYLYNKTLLASEVLQNYNALKSRFNLK
jgi:hypothetical protein